jgi:hypothetical protein
MANGSFHGLQDMGIRHLQRQWNHSSQRKHYKHPYFYQLIYLHKSLAVVIYWLRCLPEVVTYPACSYVVSAETRARARARARARVDVDVDVVSLERSRVVSVLLICSYERPIDQIRMTRFLFFLCKMRWAFNLPYPKLAFNQ